jgi:uncharacterized protein YxjI
MSVQLLQYSKLIIRQRRELAEIFGFETRNKYEICDEHGQIVGYCAEQNKGFLGFLFRQILGHWRSFEIHFFDHNRNEFLKTHHPFRFIFQEFTVMDAQNNPLGRVHQRFGILTKKYDVQDTNGRLIFSMRSGLLSFWTFPFMSIAGVERAVVQKKWSGFFKELFLDADNFLITYNDSTLTEKERQLILAASVFTDLQYFERKAK